jgi:phage gpG-like protein
VGPPLKVDFDLRTDAGLERARARLQGIRERAQNLLPAWDTLLDWWAEQNRLQWATNGARWGKPWEPLAPRTLANKRRYGYPRDILVRTHDLRDEMTKRPFGVESFDHHGAVAGTNLPYARYHQRGTDRMPRRRIVDARRVRAEGVTGRAVINWVVHGERSTAPRPG